MMRLSLMHRVMQTVGDDWSFPFAEQILERWGYDPGTVYYFRGSANFITIFRREGQYYFLRFNESSERTLESVEAEVALVDWLHKSGINVAAPIASRTGRLVESVTTDLGTFIAVVFSAMPGDHPEIGTLGSEGFKAWGAALGKLHAAMKGAPVGQNRPTWRDQLELVRLFIEADDLALQAEWQYLTDWAGALPTGSEEFGLIHYDFELDNLRWHEDKIGILDFDDCVHSWYVADIAYALRDLFEDGVDLNDPRFQAFVAGYKEYLPINPALLDQLPNFMRMHKMVLFGRLARAVNLQVSEELPAWLQGLITKLQGRIDQYRVAPQA